MPPNTGACTLKDDLSRSADSALDGNDNSQVRVLVVEDKSIDRRVADFMLRKLGYHIDFAPNGSEAIKMLEQTSFDLVLMDCVMPVMDGFEATAMIRDPESPVLNHKIPIIAITAASMENNNSKYLAAGMDNCIVKPLSLPKLNAAITECLASDTGLAAAKTAERAIFDRHELAERLMHDEDLMHDIIEDFLRNLPLQLEALEAAVKNSDVAQIPILIHTIKDPAMTISAAELYKHAQKIENAISSGNLKETGLLMPELKQAAARLTASLRLEIVNNSEDRELLRYTCFRKFGEKKTDS